MKKPTKSDARLVKIETLYLVAAITFFAGLLGGVVLGVYKSGSGLPPQTQAPSEQTKAEMDAAAALLQQIPGLEQETAANPKNSQAWKALGNLYFDTGQNQKAIKA